MHLRLSTVSDRAGTEAKTRCSTGSLTWLSEYAELERELADPAVHSDQEQARTLGRRYAELTPIVHAYREWQQTVGRRGDGPRARRRGRLVRRRGRPARQAPRASSSSSCRSCWCPRDPNDDKDVILEVKAGEGGEESALFAGDLLRMYLRYAERRGWKTEILDATVTGLGGYKDATVAVKAARAADGVWSRLKYEGGVHRVQRVPVTESQGRIHTSAAGVLVAPEADAGRGADRRQRPADRRVPLLGPRRPEREHDRLGGADHPPADRDRRLLPEREEPAAEQGAGAARSCAPGCSRRPQAEADAKASGRAAQPGRARWTGRSGSAPTTSRRTASPTTGWATRPTTWTRCSTGTWTRVIDALAAADLEAKLAGAGDDEPAARRGRAGRAAAGRRRGGLAAHRRRADRRQRARRPPRRAAHGARRRLRRAVLGRDRPPGGARAAPAHHRQRPLPLPRARRGARGVRAAPGDRGDDRLGDRPAAGRWTSPSRWWPTWAPVPARSRWPSRQEVPRARVHAVEADPLARAWAERNISKCVDSAPYTAGRVMLHARRLRRRAAGELDGTVDLVISNPPYIPVGASVEPEVSEYDPPAALWSGTDGLDAIRAVERTARRLLRPGGLRRRRARGASRARRCTGYSRRSRAGGTPATTRTWPAVTASSPPPGRAEASADEQALRLPGSRRSGPRAIEAAVTAARAGELIVLPTDTVYGIGADAFIPAAVTTLLAAKGRGRDMPPPVLVGHRRAAAAALVDDLGAFGAGPDRRVLAGRAHPGVPGQPDADLGPGRHQGHGRGPDAAALGRAGRCSSRPGRWRCAAPTGTASPPATTRGRARSSSSARRSRSTWTAARAPATSRRPSST